MKLSAWVRDEHCCYRYILGTDPLDIKNRVAFIEKTPRIRAGTTATEDYKNWIQGNKGTGCSGDDDAEKEKAYGFYQPSRNWCDFMLISLEYQLPTDRNLTVDEVVAVENTKLIGLVEHNYNHQQHLFEHIEKGTMLL